MEENEKLKEELKNIADQLANKDMKEYRIKREHVTRFGDIIRNRSDFLHFHGTAQKGGDVIYIYLDEPRS